MKSVVFEGEELTPSRNARGAAVRKDMQIVFQDTFSYFIPTSHPRNRRRAPHKPRHATREAHAAVTRCSSE